MLVAHPTAWVRARAVRAYRRIKNLGRPSRLTRDLNRWKVHRADVVDVGRRRPNPRVDILGLNARQLRTLEAEAQRDGVAVVARIDQDGYWESGVGPIDGMPALADGSFVPRRRFSIDVVWSPEYFGVRKRYRGNRLAFLNELAALHRLGELGMRVPSILDVDFDDPALVILYVPGRVLRNELVKAGALIRNRDQARGSTRGESWQRALAAGREVLPQVATKEFIAELARDLQRFHTAGLMIIDIKWGNIIIGDDGHPRWIDFHLAEDHSELSHENFRVLAALDRKRFLDAFGADYATLTGAIYHRSDAEFGRDRP